MSIRSVRAGDLVAPFCLLLTLLYFSAMAEGYGSPEVFLDIAGQAAPLVIVACAQMLVVLVGGFDISVGAIVAFCCVTTATAIDSLGPLGLVVGPFTGLLCGAVNGLLIGRLGVQPVVATLGMLGTARGLALLVSNDRSVVLDTNPLSWLGYGDVVGLPAPAFVFLIVAAAVFVFTSKTRAGRRLYAVGSNEPAAQLVGLNVRSTIFLAYAACGLLCGLASLIYVGRAGAGIPTEADGLELMAIAAVIIGGCKLGGGTGNVVGVVVGALFVQSLSSGFDFLGTSPFAKEIVLGGVVIAASVLAFGLRWAIERGQVRSKHQSNASQARQEVIQTTSNKGN